MDIETYMKGFRQLVAGIDTKIPLTSGKMAAAINFDNGATTPPFMPVLRQIMNFAPWYSSVHRGAGYKSRLCSKLFEDSRKRVLNFVNADEHKYTAIYVKNATEAINKLSYRLCYGYKKCIVLSTSMEHHSNDLPWRGKFIVDYVSVDNSGRLSIDDLEHKLYKYGGKVKLVTVAGASNVTGVVNPIHKIAAIAHKHGAMICVDGAQLVPHMPVSMRGENEYEDIDFLAFSAHKMYAPFGTGVLIGLKKVFEEGAPDYVGGGTVKIVTPEIVKWDAPPHKEEAGSPNLMGIVALVASIDTLQFIGMDKIDAYERYLTEYTLEKLKTLHGICIYGVQDTHNRLGIIPFNIKGIHHSIVAEALSGEAGISVRNGCFCAQPYIQKLLGIGREELEAYINNPDALRPGMVRISLGLYNNRSEIDVLAYALRWIWENKEYIIAKYGMVPKMQAL